MFRSVLMGLQGYRLNPVADLVSPRFKVTDCSTGRIARLGETAVRLYRQSDIKRPMHSKTCVLVASGPSMASIPFQSFTERDSFCVNGAVALFKDKNFGPTYYVCNDHGFSQERYDLVLEGVTRAEYSFLSPAALSLLMERDPSVADASRIVLLERADQRFQSLAMTSKRYKRFLRSSPDFLYDPSISASKAIGFSKNIDQGFCDVRTVAYIAIQIAYSLGFKNCLMGGVDLGGENRCYAEENPYVSYLEQNFEKYILPGFKLAAQLARLEGFNLYNLSMESKIPNDVVRKISLEGVLEMVNS